MTKGHPDKVPPGSYLSECWCGGCLGTHFIVTEGKYFKTEVCPKCGGGNVYQRVGREWVRIE